MKKKNILTALLFLLVVAFVAGCANDASYVSPWSTPRQTAAGVPMATPAPAGVVPESVAVTARGAILDSDMMWMASPEAVSDDVSWEELAESGERHLIQTGSVEMDAENFDDVVALLRDVVPHVGGFIASESLTNQGRRVLSMVMRVPADRFVEMFDYVQLLGEVRFASSRADDVTDRFTDLASDLSTRRIEEERLLALIDEATGITDLLALETRLSNVRFQIESTLSLLNNMASQIAYSTIHITLFEPWPDNVPAILPGIGERIGGAFGDSVDSVVRGFQGVVVWFAGAVLPLMMVGIVGLGIFFIVRRIMKKAKVTGVKESS